MLSEACVRTGWRMYVYVLMPNHYRLQVVMAVWLDFVPEPVRMRRMIYPRRRAVEQQRAPALSWLAAGVLLSGRMLT